MNNLFKHKELLDQFLNEIEEVSSTARSLHILTGEQDFMAMDVLINMLFTAMCNNDLRDLTEVMADFAVRNSKKNTEQDAISDLINQTQTQRGLN